MMLSDQMINKEHSANATTGVKASVIVVNYNGGEMLGRCLHSLGEERGDDREIILVDNASTDGSADRVATCFPGVQVIRSETNGGYGYGNNLGAHQANGDYLAFLNPDTVVEPGWLDHLIAALEADPRAGLATSRILLLADPQRVNTGGNDVHLTGLTLCRGMGLDRNELAEAAEVAAVSGAAFAVRRDLFERLGGFDESFFLYMEDTDLSWRARLAGYRCLYVPESIVYHDYSLRFNARKTAYQERNRYVMLLKALRWPTLLALLPALVLAEVVTWGFVLLRERRNLGNKLEAYVWPVRRWREVMAGRRRTQALRRVRDRDILADFRHRLEFSQTGGGAVARIASWLFDPTFFLLKKLALGLVWW